jgi:hypothetical protein
MSMNRKQFLRQATCYGFCTAAGASISGTALAADPEASPEDKAKARMARWIADVVASAESEDERTQLARALQSCGRSCFRRAKAAATQDVAGDLDAFLLRFQEMLGADSVTRDGDVVHLRFPLDSCLCPVAGAVPVRPDDLFCNCSRGWVQAAFEVALGRIPRVECLESFRRGGTTCRFDVFLS